MDGEGRGGVTVNAGPYSGVDYTTRESEGSTKLLSQMGRRRIADEDAANRAMQEATAANLRPLGAENPVQAEDPYLPDGTENPNFNWGGAPQADRPSYAEAQDIEAQKQAQLTAEANKRAAEQQAALQKQAAEQAQQWAQRIDKDSSDLAKVSDPQQLLADPRDKAPRRWLTNLMIAMNNGANIVAGGNGEGALQKQINHDLDMDQQRKEFALKAVLERAKQNGASAETLSEIAKRGGDRIEATRQALLKRFESDTMAALSAYPQHKQAAQMELAKIQQQNAQRMSNLVLEHTGSTQGGKTTTVTGDKGTGGGRQTPTTKETMDQGQVEENAEFARRIQELDAIGIKIKPEWMKEYARNKAALIERTEAEMHGGAPSRAWTDIGQFAGTIPESIYPEELREDENDPPDVAMRKSLTRERIDKEQSLGHQGFVAKFGQTAGSQPSGRSEYGAPVIPGMSGPALEGQGDIDRKGGELAKLWKNTGRLAAQYSKTGAKEQRDEARRPALDLARIKSSLPADLQTKLDRAMKSKNPKERAEAAAFLERLGAGK